MEFLGYIILFLVFWGTATLFPTAAVPFPSQGFQSLHILVNTCHFLVLFFSFLAIAILMGVKWSGQFFNLSWKLPPESLSQSLQSITCGLRFRPLRRDLIDGIFYLKITKSLFSLLIFFPWKFLKGSETTMVRVTQCERWVIKVADTDYGNKTRVNTRQLVSLLCPEASEKGKSLKWCMPWMAWLGWDHGVSKVPFLKDNT